MPDLSIEKLLFFLFAVLPGFIAIQTYGLKCPTPKRDWGNSLIEAVTYSLLNLVLWLWWVVPIIQTPFGQLNQLNLSAAIFCVCLLSPALLALCWHKLRTSIL